ncbi:MAG: hypothetical protein KBS86_03290 [Proteobacteria bacterium]|nr:hypothetical protein [Candidatus Enterousia scatequi]
MLDGILVFSSDSVWRQILTDLGANVLSAPTVLSVNIDDLHLNKPLSVIDLKMQLLRLMDNANVFKVLFGKNIPMFSSLQRNIIIAIYKTGGVSGKDLRDILGFSPDITTHTVDTAISQIRKTAGHDFIQNKNGKYIIGNV